MAKFDTEREDAALDLRRRGSVMQTVGWWLLIFDALVVVFVWVGLRTGSLFWLWWCAIEGLLGIILIAWGAQLKLKAGKVVSESERYRKAG